MDARVEELFHAVADLSKEARSRYFADHRIGAEERRAVESLLWFDGHSTRLLEEQIGCVAQGAMARVAPQELPCGPYRLGNLLGSGGMGSVYSAERADGEVAQRVAVKLLRPGADAPELRQRFLAERQILATLSHPNIARLLDAGHRQDGQPYLVMEYVEGKPIDVYAAGLGVRRKLRLFLKVCAAVSYLHRNLVVHRDLKPANVLVTPEGEPKLLDFGIAKLVDSAESTTTNSRMLTPAYASPEQVSGEPITTASDVYSLGAVLYKLLTGSSPHQFAGESAGAMALAIFAGKITPPSQRAAGLKGDLEFVVMKALRTEPQERYPSADALADDLRACLERRPVQARAGDVWYRTRRLLRRYWAPTLVTVSVIVGLAGGLCVAVRERGIAERRFGQLRQLSNRVIDFDRAIRVLPGSVAARQQMVAASLEFLEGLSRDAAGNLDLTQEISDGYWRLGRIQGVNAEFNLGDTKKAEDSLKQADALLETVLSARPKDRGAIFRSAIIAHDRMILADTEERWGDVQVHARKAVGRLEAFALLDDPAHPVRLDGFLRAGDAREAERTGAANLYVNIALTYVHGRLYDQGAHYARRAVDLAGPIASAQDVASQGWSVLASALRSQGDLEPALDAVRHARSLSERAVYPSETARLFSLYGVMLREGRILGEEGAVNLGRPAEAIAVLQRSLDMMEEAARRDASDSATRARLGITARELGDILRDRDPRRALDVYDLGLHRLTESRSSLKARRDRAQLLAKSSYPLRRLHREEEARARLDAARATLAETGDYPAERIRLGSYAYTMACALADHEAETGGVERARRMYAELLGKVMASRLKPDSVLADALGLSRVYTAMARLERRAGRADLASALESRRLDLWRNWKARLPNNHFVCRQLRAAGGV